MNEVRKLEANGRRALFDYGRVLVGRRSLSSIEQSTQAKRIVKKR